MGLAQLLTLLISLPTLFRVWVPILTVSARVLFGRLRGILGVEHGLGGIEIGWRRRVGGFVRERSGGGEGGVDG
jgi:hypothetical protein